MRVPRDIDGIDGEKLASLLSKFGYGILKRKFSKLSSFDLM